MLKKQIILYFGALLITFLAVYIKNLSSSYYPVTSTFGIEGNKVSYRLDKIHYGKDPLKIMLITDLQGIDGKVTWKKENEINESMMNYADRILCAEIPASEPLTQIDYQILLRYNNRSYIIPRNSTFITVDFYGGIPKVIKWLHYLLLFLGIFLSIRTGLELFDENKKSKKISIVVLSVFIVFSFIINPLKNSYKLGVINKSIPAITEIFDLQSILFASVWLIAVPVIFNKKTSKPGVIFASLLTIIIFIFLPIEF